MSGRIDTVQSVTTAPKSLAADQHSRIRRYLLTMLIRTACFIAAVLLSGWMRWTAVALAVVLPYIAVILANAAGPRAEGTGSPVSAPVPLITSDPQPGDVAQGTGERTVLDGVVVEPRASDD